MKIVKASYEILTNIERESILKTIEVAGRTCYKSEDLMTENSASAFVQMIKNRGHLSVLEHVSISVRFTIDRGVSHELIRHRLASYSQESTRYCNYSKSKFGEELTFIDPTEHMSIYAYATWKAQMLEAEEAYLYYMETPEAKPEMARSILPNSLKTELVMTANLREWLEVFSQRTAPAAHPQMREVMIPLRDELADKLPEIFG